MKDSELQFDREKHILYSAHAKRVLVQWLKDTYGDAWESIWERVQLQYVRFLEDAPAVGGKSSPHAAQIYDSILLFSYCVAAPKKHTLEELQPLAFEIFMAPFRPLGKIFNANHKWTMDLMGVIFRKTGEKSNRHAERYPNDFTAAIEPYDKENGVARYSFTRCPNAEFAKQHGLEEWMPLLCNCDHLALKLIHAGLIREGTCTESSACDYCVVGDHNPLLEEYTLETNDKGLLVSSRKQNRL